MTAAFLEHEAHPFATAGNWADVRKYGAVGDGRDDTAAIQRAIDDRQTVYFSKPRSVYLAEGLRLNTGQRLIGPGRYAKVLINGGNSPIFVPKTQDGTTRQVQFSGLRMHSMGHPAILAHGMVETHVDDCWVQSTSANAIDARGAYRSSLRNSTIHCSGEFTAINAVDNCNGLVISGNTVTGGRAGTAIVVEQSQAVMVTGNKIESSYGGILVASTNLAGKGNCNGLTITGNYIEQSAMPLALGLVSTVLGGLVEGNYIGNAQSSVVSDRTAAVALGRVQQTRVEGNSLYVLEGRERFFDLHLISTNGAGRNLSQMAGLVVRNNYLHGTPSDLYRLHGAFAANTSVQRGIGSDAYFDFLPGARMDTQEWVSETINLGQEYQPRAWLPRDGLALGGRLLSAEVIDITGQLPSMRLQMGRWAQSGEMVNAWLNELSVTNGRAAVPLVTHSPLLMSDVDNLLRISGHAPTSTTCRVRLKYRAQ